MRESKDIIEIFEKSVSGKTLNGFIQTLQTAKGWSYLSTLMSFGFMIKSIQINKVYYWDFSALFLKDFEEFTKGCDKPETISELYFFNSKMEAKIAIKLKSTLRYRINESMNMQKYYSVTPKLKVIK